MRVLGIETSCDETAVSLIEASGDFGADFTFRVLGNALLSQTGTHVRYGGVVPNLARNEHAKNIVPMLERALEEAGSRPEGHTDISAYDEKIRNILAREPELYVNLKVFFEKYAKPAIDCIAVTYGPGLPPALWVGVNFARALSVVWNVPVVAVNHMEGHIVMSMMQVSTRQQEHSNILENVGMFGTMYKIEFPLLSLLISGGHTELVLSKEWQKYEILGATRDDAVGEAFDKVARFLGLPYPGGPHISRLAEKARASIEMTSHWIKLPRPMLHDDNFEFSFAGLKTAVRKIVDANSPLTEETKLAIAREFEDAVSDVLVGKTIRACDEYGVQTVVVGGGVSANKHIRLRLAEALAEAGLPRPLVPPPALATDNALMIALAGYFHAVKKEFANPETLEAKGDLRL
ncbi:MAG: tRNA (adenosine(37)-N6)-threonylcarbamoyltransferase complex transferase subunit TsaD [bacterium]|nr:tRNA (adenosine(37)-N6)-threonylcarbamoyltransferase complex transferase subunit TsaD [bacterium]